MYWNHVISGVYCLVWETAGIIAKIYCESNVRVKAKTLIIKIWAKQTCNFFIVMIFFYFHSKGFALDPVLRGRFVIPFLKIYSFTDYLLTRRIIFLKGYTIFGDAGGVLQMIRVIELLMTGNYRGRALYLKKHRFPLGWALIRCFKLKVE